MTDADIREEVDTFMFEVRQEIISEFTYIHIMLFDYPKISALIGEVLTLCILYFLNPYSKCLHYAADFYNSKGRTKKKKKLNSGEIANFSIKQTNPPNSKTFD